MARTRTATVSPKNKTAKSYKHPESESPMRPDVGTQSEFKKKLPPNKYRYDDSLSPVLEWDGQNAARERGEARIAKAEAELAEARKPLNRKPETKDAAAHVIAAQKAVTELKAMSKPLMNWAGKAERLSFDVPTLPLFIHERLSTKAILETLKGHKQIPTLTPREKEIAQLLAEGKSTKEVASILNLSTKTAETHRANVMQKLDIHSLSELVLYAVRNNIVQV
jgi:DNA-binding CsgD family transcriptional regulator